MPRCDYLIAVLNVFIDEFGGNLRMRALKAAFLIQKATVDGTGISLSRIAKEIEAPLENVRRHVTRQMESGILSRVDNPNDERATAVVLSPPRTMHRLLSRLATRLDDIEPKPPVCHRAARDSKPTCDRLISVLDAYIDEFGGGLRVRGVKTALLIQRATLEGRGISVSEIARETGAPLENVRRHLAKHAAMGRLRYMHDPEDARVTRVVFTRPDIIETMSKRVADRLQEITTAV